MAADRQRTAFAARQAGWARLLIGSLAGAGIRHVVISPGSRSTPFALAASRHSELHCHALIDERSAGFFALGMARITGCPSLLLCTSGSAAANYFPAVAEASASYVPLVVLTADRPIELAHCGANQTLDQIKLYGDHARAFFDLGLADDSPRALRALRRQACQALARAMAPEPGAVHLNARARKPLEPPTDSAAGDFDREVDELLIERPQVHLGRPRVDEGALDQLATALRDSRRALIVCGPAPAAQRWSLPAIAELSKRCGAAVLAEATSQLRFRSAEVPGTWIDAIDPLLDAGTFDDADCLLQIGRPPTSGAWLRFLSRRPSIEHWSLAEYGWQDAESTADVVLVGDVQATVEEVVERLTGHKGSSHGDRASPDDWTALDRRACEVLLELAAGDSGTLRESSVTRLAARSMPTGGVLAIGNSLPVRWLDLFVPPVGIDVTVVSQRGASGIDGLVSGAAGACLASDRPTLLLLGDVSLLHDLTGLAAGRLLSAPFVVVVINNDGGRIFEQLPVAAAVDASERALWLTPHGHSFEAAADMFSFEYRAPSDDGELEHDLRQAFATPGDHESANCWLIEARVPANDATNLRRQLTRRMAEVLAT